MYTYYLYVMGCVIPPEYKCHVYVRSDQLSCVIIGDQDYPVRVAFTLMNKVMIQHATHIAVLNNHDCIVKLCIVKLCIVKLCCCCC